MSATPTFALRESEDWELLTPSFVGLRKHRETWPFITPSFAGSRQYIEHWELTSYLSPISPQHTEPWELIVPTFGDDSGTSARRSRYVFVKGAGVQLGAGGSNYYAYVSGDHMIDAGDSVFVYESGIGVNARTPPGGAPTVFERWEELE